MINIEDGEDIKTEEVKEDIPIDNPAAEEKEAEEASAQDQEEPEKEARKKVDMSALKKKDKDKEKKKKKDPRDEKIAELNDRHMRLMAEFENFRKRTDKEKETMFETGAKSVIEKMLPVVDNFERALANTPEGADPEKKDPFVEGMEMIYKQLMTELDNLDVKPIEAAGKPFDPNLHNAVMQVENEELESGTVAAELQKGYTYRGSVVRHSMVSVVQ